MRKIFFILFASFAFGANFNMPEFHTTLLSVDKDLGVIKDSPDIVVGSSGVVMHSFGDDLKSIIARVVVDEKDGDNAKVHFEVYSGLKQNSLPLPNFVPQAGDEVILNYLYDRSLIITPNYEVYSQILDVFKNISFIHPDLVGAMLNIDYKPNPDQDDFSKACSVNAAGLIFIALEGEAVFADCNSFKVIKSFKSGEIANYDLPFYTRVKNITALFWDINARHISDYNRYYRSLLQK